MADTVQCWLVERTYDDKGLIRITYAPTDASGQHVTEKAAASNPDVTAAVEIDPEKLDPIDDGTTRERYAAEAERMAERHEPGESV